VAALDIDDILIMLVIHASSNALHPWLCFVDY